MTTAFFLLHLSITAQIKASSQVISSVGMASQNLGLRANATVGEVVIFSQSQNTFYVGQGFQNTELIKIVSAKDPFKLPQSIKLYPNPAHNLIFIDSEEEVEALSIINNSGYLINIQHQKTDKYFDISFLKEGIYYLNIKFYNQRTQHLTFIKL